MTSIALKLFVSKKTAALALVLAFSLALAAAVLIVEEAKANPWIIFKAAEPIPGTTPPIITLFSPQNNTAYASNSILLSFNVTKPQPPLPLDSGISYVRYTLDGNLTGLYFCDHYSSSAPPGIPDFGYSQTLTVPDGEHTLLIEAAGVVLPGNLTLFWMDSNATIFFSVHSEQPEPELAQSPSPSPDSSLSQSSQEANNQLEAQPFPTALVTTSVALVAVVSAGLVVYFCIMRLGKVKRV